jgi:hypothetical protein
MDLATDYFIIKYIIYHLLFRTARIFVQIGHYLEWKVFLLRGR